MKVPWTAKRSIQTILKEINTEYSLGGLIGKLKVKVKVAQFCLTLCDPMDAQSKDFSRPEYWSG